MSASRPQTLHDTQRPPSYNTVAPKCTLAKRSTRDPSAVCPTLLLSTVGSGLCPKLRLIARPVALCTSLCIATVYARPQTVCSNLERPRKPKILHTDVIQHCREFEIQMLSIHTPECAGQPGALLRTTAANFIVLSVRYSDLLGAEGGREKPERMCHFYGNASLPCANRVAHRRPQHARA